jgi:hypothetical protein
VSETSPSPALERILDACVSGRPFISKQSLPGCRAWMLNGHLLAGVIGERLVFRLSEEEIRRMAEQIPHLIPWMEFDGRRLPGYAMLPGVSPDPTVVGDLAWRSLVYVESMPTDTDPGPALR